MAHPAHFESKILEACQGKTGRALTDEDFIPLDERPGAAQAQAQNFSYSNDAATGDFYLIKPVTLDCAERIAVAQLFGFVTLMLSAYDVIDSRVLFNTGYMLLGMGVLYDFMLLVTYGKDLNILTKIFTVFMAVGLLFTAASRPSRND